MWRKWSLSLSSAVLLGSLGILLAFPAGEARADGGVTFENIAADDGAGITYRRALSPRDATWRTLLEEPSPILNADFLLQNTDVLPMKWRGAPGVALLDYDRDGDLDIYVTNGPNASNALYSSQLIEGGELTFVDVAAEAGVEAFDQDSSGVCFGDLDNDGDEDLYVLGTNEMNRLFENQGDGTFVDITAASGTSGDGRNSTGCSMADFDGDGLLDIVVGNAYDSWEHRKAHRLGPTYDMLEHNYHFRNTGGNVFTDVSVASGLETVSNMDQMGLSGAAYTWALATADYDFDGDVDILFADNQAAPPQDPSEERGYLRLYENDGTGTFTEVTYDAELDIPGGWMGLDFGDLNCDGNMDFFATDVGFAAGAPSRWFFGQNDGTFIEPGLDGLIMTPFGWGVSIFDYDNDADSDVIYHGGMLTRSIFIADNPGVVLQNTGDCSGVFDWDDAAIPTVDIGLDPPPPLTDHNMRLVQGVAAGDLNRDGFEDVVTVADTRIDPRIYVPGVGPPFFIWGPATGSPFDAVAFVEAIYAPFPMGSWTLIAPTDGDGVVIPHLDGDLSVELNSADNGNGWTEVTVVGSAGLLEGGMVNRDGIGAVVFFTPDGGNTSIRPIIGGSSYASQDALAANFGLGDATHGTVEVLWPGGVRNRLDKVAAGERVVMPHIPCSYDADWASLEEYSLCVRQALRTYARKGVISGEQRSLLLWSALRAYQEAQEGGKPGEGRAPAP